MKNEAHAAAFFVNFFKLDSYFLSVNKSLTFFNENAVAYFPISKILENGFLTIGQKTCAHPEFHGTAQNSAHPRGFQSIL